ncbi:MAG: radical SAM protein [Nitrospirae bacterium]|nr:radical SAM protein [Nitrospirota bacterium]
MNCSFCTNKKIRNDITSSSSNSLTLRDIKQIIKEAALNSSFLYLIGGEPLIFKDIVKVLSYIKEENICASLTSNGLLVEKYAIEIINTLSFISISIDGGSADIHDTLRGSKGCFDKTVKGINELIRLRGNNILPNIKIATVITKSNIDNLPEIYKLCKDLKVDEWQISHNCFYSQKIIDSNLEFEKKYHSGKNIEGQFIDSLNYLDDDEISLLIEKINSILNNSTNDNLIITIHPPLNSNNIYPYYQGKSPKNIKSLCDLPFNRLTVRGNGDVELCQGVIVGNIYKNSLKECWSSKEAEYFRGLIKDKKFTPACYRCCELRFSL